MPSSEPSIQMRTKPLPLGSPRVSVLRRWGERACGEQKGVKHEPPSSERSGEIFLFAGQGGFFLISSSLLFPQLSQSLKIFIFVFSLERIIMDKLFHSVALSFIWSRTQESPGGLQRLITIHKAHKMDLDLKHFESCEASEN